VKNTLVTIAVTFLALAGSAWAQSGVYWGERIRERIASQFHTSATGQFLSPRIKTFPTTGPQHGSSIHHMKWRAVPTSSMKSTILPSESGVDHGLGKLLFVRMKEPRGCRSGLSEPSRDSKASVAERRALKSSGQTTNVQLLPFLVIYGRHHHKSARFRYSVNKASLPGWEIESRNDHKRSNHTNLGIPISQSQ
jgi:hypothetical protein